MTGLPADRRLRTRWGRMLACLMLAAMTVCLTVPAASPAPRKASATIKRAGELTVFVGPLLPATQTRGRFLRGEEVSVSAALIGLRGEPTLEVKARKGWKSVKRVETNIYKTTAFFNFNPLAGERRYRVLWSRRGKTRVTNSVKVTSTERWTVTPVIEGIAASARSIRISGNGAVLAHQADLASGGGLFVTDRTGAVETVVPDGSPALESISTDGSAIYYSTGKFDDAQPLAATRTVFRFDRATKVHTALATWKVYDSSGTQTRFLAASGDGQHVLFQQLTDGIADALVLRNLATAQESVVYALTAEERSTGMKVAAATISDDGGAVAFSIGKGNSLSVRMWRQSDGQATEVATSSGPPILGSTGGGTVLRMSNDATRILFDNQRRLQVLDVTGAVVTVLPLDIVIGSTRTAELSGNGATVLLESGAAVGLYRIATGQWLSLEPQDDPEVASVADDGRTIPFTRGVSGERGGLHLLLAP